MEIRREMLETLPDFIHFQEFDIGSPATLSKSEQTYEQMKNMILNAVLKPGQRISEDDIAQRLQTSRTPVRDAMRRLANDGLITIYPKRYAEVTFFSKQDIRMIGTLRMNQDILSERLALYYGSDADFDQLIPLAERCEEYNKKGDLYGRIFADMTFHLKITEIGRNELLLKYQRELYMRLHLMQIQYAAAWDDTKERVDHHTKIIESLMKRDEKSLIETSTSRLQRLYDLDPKIKNMFV